MKKIIIIISALSLLFLSSCGHLSNPKFYTYELTGSDIGTVGGDAHGGADLTITVPFGSDVTALVAVFTVPARSTQVLIGGITQESGVTVNDFSNPITYTIIAPDGTKADIIVTVLVGSYSELYNMIRNGEDVTGLDTSDLFLMDRLFKDQVGFNQDISGWDVSNVTKMNSMFEGASSFNQDISGWDVRNVVDMRFMFDGARSFNQDISGWDVSNVTDMYSMFKNAIAFNQNLSNWNVSLVTNMSRMFYSATSFNGDISSWNVSNVTGMDYMFYDATAFNQDISSWRNYVSESLTHKYFSGGTCTLPTAYHPYASWNDK